MYYAYVICVYIYIYIYMYIYRVPPRSPQGASTRGRRGPHAGLAKYYSTSIVHSSSATIIV